MAELLNYDRYRLRFSLFRTSHLTAPIVFPIARLQLPKMSLLHFAPVDGVTIGPQISDPLMRSVPGVIYVDHVKQYTAPIGNPIRAFTQADSMITLFRQRNRAFRPLRKLERLETDERTLVVYNYALLSHLVRYATSFRAGWYMWYNVYSEVMLNINKTAEVSHRHQFIELNLPDVMPGLGTLREFSTRQTADTLGNLRDDGAKQVADLFVWAGKLRENSVLSKIHPDNYSRTNLIIRRLNGFVSVNLGWLDSLRAQPGRKSKTSSYEPAVFQLMLLKMLTTLHQATSPIDTPTKEETVDEPLVELDTVDESIDDVAFDANLDAEIDIGNELVNDDEMIAALEKELQELDALKIAAREEASQYTEDGEEILGKTIDVNVLAADKAHVSSGSAIVDKAMELAGKGLLTAAEFRRLERVSKAVESLPDPYGNGDSLLESIVIPAEDIAIKPKVLGNQNEAIDKSQLLSSVDTFERQYITKALKKDIIRCVLAVQKAPVAITGYSIDRVTTATNDQEVHVIKLTPAVGESSTLRFPIPVVKEDGSFLYNGTRYRMRKQRSDLPIRKLDKDKVGLSSYYGKVFIERSERKNFNYEKWFMGELILKAQNPEDPNISKSMISQVVDYRAAVPRIYTAISEEIMYLKIGTNELWFDYKRRIEKWDYSKAELAFEKKSWVLCGRGGKKEALIMDPAGMVYRIVMDANGGRLEDVATIASLCGLETEATSPISSVEAKIFSKNIPIGLCLAYLLGFNNLLAFLKVKPRRVLAGARLNLEPDEYAIRFVDESLVFSRKDVVPTMILSGLNLAKDAMRNYAGALFDSKDVYSAVFDRSNIGSRYLRELDSLDTFFIDPITEGLLVWMKEPTSFTGLLVRAVEMLVSGQVDAHRKDKDNVVELLERVRGYERIAGMVYSSLVTATKRYNARAASGRGSIQMKPTDPINDLIKDPTTSPVNNINPIHALREREVITFGGKGGRSRRAMVARTRLFTNEDRGLISEATVDSGDVGIIAYLPQNPNLTSIYGTVRLYDEKRDGATSIMSTPALLGVGADGDDPKRIGFSAIQHGHGIATDNYELSPGRTGMEDFIAPRSGPEFAQVAQGKGKVKEVGPHHIAVEYENGDVTRHPLGLIKTMAEGTQYPNTLVTPLKVGDEVEEFDILTYNKGFFKLNPLNPKRAAVTLGCLARVAIREATYTLEDSCSLSSEFAKRMVSRVIKPKPIQASFHDEIRGLVKVGDKVDLETTLCSIEGEVSSAAGLFDESNLDTLKLFTPASPKAKLVGEVVKVEVFYNGDPEDMSESLQVIVAESEKNRRRIARSLGEEYTTGKVERNVRLEGYNVEAGRALIIVDIMADVPMGIADKLVIGNQMKSVVGAVLYGENQTESGETVDIIFGALSAVNRIVTGLFTGGSLNTTVRIIGEEMYNIYFEDNT